MTDLAERFARTQGETKCRFHGGYIPKGGAIANYDSPMCTCRIPAIDVNILPIIWADCKAKGWTVDTLVLPNRSETRIWRDYFADGIPLSFATANLDPVAALCEAYCSAKEAAE